MGLKKVVSLLLPAPYRQQVLGDLQERGFRARDIASVLPRVWWSHLNRFPALGPEHLELRRSQQRLEARRRWFGLLYAATVVASLPYNPGFRTFKLVILCLFACAVPLSLVFGSRAQV